MMSGDPVYYIVQQGGDCIPSIAAENGHPWDTLLNLPHCRKLAQKCDCEFYRRPAGSSRELRDRRIGDVAAPDDRLRAWNPRIHQESSKIRWQFTSATRASSCGICTRRVAWRASYSFVTSGFEGVQITSPLRG
jgi:hypothetical protein